MSQKIERCLPYLITRLLILGGSGFVPVPPSSLGGLPMNNCSYRTVIFGLRSGIFLRRLYLLTKFSHYPTLFKFHALNTMSQLADELHFIGLYVKGISPLA